MVAPIREWATSVIGLNLWTCAEERALRIVEEAIELAQACGVPQRYIQRLVERVYQRPAAHPDEEIGGLLVTVMAFCASQNLNPDYHLFNEVIRIIEKKDEVVLAKCDEKWNAGVAYGVDGSAPCEIRSIAEQVLDERDDLRYQLRVLVQARDAAAEAFRAERARRQDLEALQRKPLR